MGNKNSPKECSIVIDTGFNGGRLRSYSWSRQYISFWGSFFHKATISKTKENLLRFAVGNQECRDSLMGAVIPIWADGTSKPARFRLIHGKAELLLLAGIVKKLDSAVNFGRNQCMFG